MDTTVPSRLQRLSTWVNIGDDIAAHNIGLFNHDPTRGTAQITIGEDFTLGMSATPNALRHLAKVIEDAAMDLERQIAEQAHADTDPLEHYSAASLAAQSAEVGK